jgi:hypothetical protein
VTDAATSPELPEVEPVRFVAPDGAPVGRGTVGAPIADDRLLSRSRIPDAACTIWVDCIQLLATRDRLDEAARDAGQTPVITRSRCCAGCW